MDCHDTVDLLLCDLSMFVGFSLVSLLIIISSFTSMAIACPCSLSLNAHFGTMINNGDDSNIKRISLSKLTKGIYGFKVCRLQVFIVVWSLQLSISILPSVTSNLYICPNRL